MKNTIKAGMYVSTALTAGLYSKAFADITTNAPEESIVGNTNSADIAIQTYIGSALTFLYIAAVVYGLYGGFQILTAGSNDDKVGQGKKIIINALIGIVVIFLAGSIVKWLLTIVTGP